tara:strand:- start:761 stop:1342 length:582 start_codon:yes stop_codon:yes gene_type:complete
VVIKIGITGSIGMGKSTVASIFKKKNIAIWDADLEVHNLYKKGNEGYNLITSIYPQVKGSDKIDRKKLSILIKKKEINLKKVENLIHPLLIKSRINFIEKNKKDKFIVFDIPLLYETRAEKWLDYVILVYCSYKNQEKRLSMRENYNKKKIKYLLSNQLNMKQKKHLANFIINTDQPIELVEKQVIETIHAID